MGRSRQHTKLDRKNTTQKYRGRKTLTPETEDLLREFGQRDVSELEAQTEAQAEYIYSITNNILTFGLGPAGTGKTYIATCLAADKLVNREIDTFIVTRPAIEAGAGLGFLPGDLSEKFAPWLAPVRHILEKRLGRGTVEMYLKNKRIQVMPLEYMRGHTLENCFVLLDEAQNTTAVQMKMFLTRLGEDNCTAVVDGDLDQCDLSVKSGLADAEHRMRGMESCGHVYFSDDDIVRSGIVRDILMRYRN